MQISLEFAINQVNRMNKNIKIGKTFENLTLIREKDMELPEARRKSNCIWNVFLPNSTHQNHTHSSKTTSSEKLF